MARRLLTIEVVPHGEQRYETCGDWYFDNDGSIRIAVSDLGNDLYAMLVGLHEAVEVVLCKQHGVTQEEVDRFDIEFNKTHPLDTEEPGADQRAPYFREHAVADVVERLVALEAGVVWKDYDDAVDGLFVKDTVAPAHGARLLATGGEE